MIARVVLELRRLVVDAHPSDGAKLKTSEIALDTMRKSLTSDATTF
jgi:hypothetical protein